MLIQKRKQIDELKGRFGFLETREEYYQQFSELDMKYDL
jgi:hypothetical protein